MHFRVRKNVIQLIRTTYDAGKKKGVNTVVGTVKLAKPVIAADLAAMLTPAEAAEFDTWLKTQHRADSLREELAALGLAETMASAECWFARTGDSLAARIAAADIVAQWQSLRRVMTKNGLLD